MARRRRGPIAKDINRLWYSYKVDQISGNEFCGGLKAVVEWAVERLGNLGFYDVGSIIQRLSDESKDQGIWQLADSVDLRIRTYWQSGSNEGFKYRAV